MKMTIEEVRAVARSVAIATAELIAEKYDDMFDVWAAREQIGDEIARTFVGCELDEPEWTRDPASAR